MSILCDICHRCRTNRSRAIRQDRDPVRKLCHFRRIRFYTELNIHIDIFQNNWIKWLKNGNLAAVFATSGRSFTFCVGIASCSVRAHSGRVFATQRLITEKSFQTFATFERTLFVFFWMIDLYHFMRMNTRTFLNPPTDWQIPRCWYNANSAHIRRYVRQRIRWYRYNVGG